MIVNLCRNDYFLTLLFNLDLFTSIISIAMPFSPSFHLKKGETELCICCSFKYQAKSSWQ